MEIGFFPVDINKNRNFTVLGTILDTEPLIVSLWAAITSVDTASAVLPNISIVNFVIRVFFYSLPWRSD
jgi:hypothetical protein